jgi:hypothetical protein
MIFMLFYKDFMQVFCIVKRPVFSPKNKPMATLVF